jgi:hypothetical protein
MAAQKATDIRRLRTEVEAMRAALQQRQAELDMPEGRNPRRQKIIAGVLDDFARLSGRPSGPAGPDEPDVSSE